MTFDPSHNKFEIESFISENDDGKMSHKLIWRKYDHGNITPYQLATLVSLVADTYIRQEQNFETFENTFIYEFNKFFPNRKDKIELLGKTPEKDRL